MEYDYEYFKNEILNITQINLHAYKEKQMKRRINTLMERKGVSGYAEYIQMLKTDPDSLAYFIDYITINVTEFFRTADHWHYMEENILPQLAKKDSGRLRIWSTACSTGEEPYSLVMSLAKYMPLSEICILATDLDQKVLKQASTGVFPSQSMEKVPEELKVRYFVPVDDGWQISEEVRRRVIFQRLDLLRDEYPKNMDLILCRNVLIYFTEDAKNRIYDKFRDTLTDGGYLFTGNTEQLLQYKKMGLKKLTSYIYQR